MNMPVSLLQFYINDPERGLASVLRRHLKIDMRMNMMLLIFILVIFLSGNQAYNGGYGDYGDYEGVGM